MPRKTRTLLLALPAIFVLALLTVFFLSVGRPPPRAPLPNPNGYDDFLKAGTLLTGDVFNASTLDHDSLRALVSTNSESLRLLRLGLTRQCALDTDAAMTNFSGMVGRFTAMRELALLLGAEGRLREMDNRIAEAAQSYVDAIQFGNETSRGGFNINRLVGIALESIGDIPLSKLVPKLKLEEARQISVELEKIDHAGVAWDEIRRDENRFARYQLGRGFHLITWVMSQWETWQVERRSEKRHKKAAARVRLLTAELAVRCYQSEQGHAPADLGQLVPKYLQRVPLDPFSDKPLIYRPQGTNWLLYSIGEDGVNDGGKPVGRKLAGTVTKGDLFYDSP